MSNITILHNGYGSTKILKLVIYLLLHILDLRHFELHKISCCFHLHP